MYGSTESDMDSVSADIILCLYLATQSFATAATAFAKCCMSVNLNKHQSEVVSALHVKYKFQTELVSVTE